MKLSITCLLFVVVLASHAQTIRIADNNPVAPTGANIYTGASALQNAINAAVADDIVYLTPSVTSYGNATVGKKITIKGVGFGIAEISPRSSTIGTLTIVNSSNGTDNVSGLVLSGFSFGTIQFSTGTGGSGVDNILAENITGSNFTHATCSFYITNLTIRNCWISIVNIGHCNGSGNLKIYRNIISSYLDVRYSGDALISNNLFVSGAGVFPIRATGSPGLRIEQSIFSGSGVAFYTLVEAVVTNNIFYGTSPNGGTTPFHSNTFSNNLVLDAFTFPPAAIGGPANSGVNNIPGTGPLFTSAPVSTGYNDTYNYTLQGTSPCIGASSIPGENIGPSGGLYPWTTNVYLTAASIPVITLLGNSGVVPQNEPLKSNIKAKAY